MKTTVVILMISLCSLIAVPSTAKAEKPRKVSCIERVYHSYFFKKSLKKKKGILINTTNHDHYKRNLGKLEGLREVKKN